MIPERAADLPALLAEIERQTGEVREIFESTPAEALAWRPSDAKWSVTGHVAHLCVVNAPYVRAMQKCLMAARDRGLSSDGPYRHPTLASWFARSMEPPPKLRVKTFKSMVPDPSLGGQDVLERFATVQGDFAQLVEDCTGIDLGRARFSSPFARYMRLSLGTGIHLLEAHNRRHVWLAREVMEQDGYPGS